MSHGAGGQVGGKQVDQGGGAVENQAMQGLSANKGKTVFDKNHYKSFYEMHIYEKETEER